MARACGATIAPGCHPSSSPAPVPSGPRRLSMACASPCRSPTATTRSAPAAVPGGRASRIAEAVGALRARGCNMTGAARTLADKLFRPERVAIVGASGDLKKNNSRPQRYLRKHGFKGAIYPINPGYKELFGEPCYPSLKATPQPADHAYVMVPTAAVEGVIRDCGKAGVAGATIFAGRLAEGGA